MNCDTCLTRAVFRSYPLYRLYDIILVIQCSSRIMCDVIYIFTAGSALHECNTMLSVRLLRSINIFDLHSIHYKLLFNIVVVYLIIT